MANLVTACPADWAKNVRPFLQRACDFDGKQPLVAYFIRTYAAHVALKAPRTAPTTKFLMTLLDALEAFKRDHAQELEQADGRTTLTRTGLMLFTRADDLERAGTVDESVVKMFFAASQVLEATKQYTDDQLDPICAEKVKYAKFVAISMKKAMDAGVAYQSPNGDASSASAPMGGGDATEDMAPPQHAPSVPPYGTATILPPQSAPPQYAPPPAPPQQPFAPSYVPAPAPAPQAYQPEPVYRPQMPPASYAPAAPQYPVPAVPATPPPPQPFATVSAPTYAPAPTAAAGAASAAQQMDKILEAQKFAKQAVSALQFYDVPNARQQLVNAIAVLDGQHPVSRK